MPVIFLRGQIRFGCIALAVVAIVTVSQIYGWSSDGHQSVGAIADVLIAKHRAAEQVASILGTAQGKQLTLASVSVWADCIRGVHPERGFIYDPGEFKERACAIFEDDAGKAAMIDYARRNNSNCQYDGKDFECHKAFHFADIPIQHTDYKDTYLGANDHDVVHAIAAALAVLQGEPAPAPFHIASQKEALMLLVHFMGDLHQPLHVAAMYLDASGKVIDPEKGVFDAKSDSHGGNSIGPKSKNLHAMWDETDFLGTAETVSPGMLESAKAVEIASVDLTSSPAEWASDTVGVARTKSFTSLKPGPLEMERWPAKNRWKLHDRKNADSDRSGSERRRPAGGASGSALARYEVRSKPGILA